MRTTRPGEYLIIPTEMRALLLSAILYLFGVAIVLYLRPALMFEADGRWKEFGTGNPAKTPLPFWLFCLAWAFVSYAVVALALSAQPAAVATTTAAIAPVAASALTEVEPPEDLVQPLPTGKAKRSKGSAAATVNTIQTPYGNMKPGYYVLDRRESVKSGIPKYIYLGAEAPEDATDATDDE